MDATILGSIITAGGTIVGAVIGVAFGHSRGRKAGFKEGRKHSLESFMDEYLKNVNDAITHIEANDIVKAKAVAKALVENVMVWRKIQSNFAELLNGLISDLNGILQSQNDPAMKQALLTIRAAYDGKRLAIETELKRSAI